MMVEGVQKGTLTLTLSLSWGRGNRVLMRRDITCFGARYRKTTDGAG